VKLAYSMEHYISVTLPRKTACRPEVERELASLTRSSGGCTVVPSSGHWWCTRTQQLVVERTTTFTWYGPGGLDVDALVSEALRFEEEVMVIRDGVAKFWRN
jgi:hypothetical protein